MKYFILKTIISSGNYSGYKEVYICYSGCMRDFGLINFSSACYFRNNAIKISEEVLKSDILKVYMAYHDCTIEEVDLANESSRNVFHTLHDYGSSEHMKYYYDYFAKQGQDYVIAPSEYRILNDDYGISLYYKIQSEIDDKVVWLDSNLNWNENADYAMILSHHCLRNIPLIMFLKRFGQHHCYYSVQLPSHYSKIFYLAEDFGDYCSKVVKSKQERIEWLNSK